MANEWTMQSLILTVGCCLCIVNAQIIEKSVGDCDEDQTKEVTVKQGTMRGSTLYSPKNVPFCGFRAIPFSQPPVGQFRFQPPRPSIPWKGILDATKDAPLCFQFRTTNPGAEGQEDCLYLNVYTTRLKPKDGKLLDVMVWLYPGLFYFGSNNLDDTGPHYLMDKEVLTVHVNFRNAAFGFLSTGDDEAQGNYGMKDQVAGLQWVQENIEAFGGNASSVTIFGLSSGAACTTLHMLSPLSKGLFHRVISLDGSAINPWARSPDPLLNAQKQARLLGCPTEPTSCLVKCLREMDGAELADSARHMFAWLDIPNTGYVPVAEYTTERNPNPFLPDDPIVLLRNGKFHRVPWLLGGTSHGGDLFSSTLLEIELRRNEFNSRFESLMQAVLMVNISVPEAQAANITRQIINHYLGPVHKIDPNQWQEWTALITDRMFIHGQYKTAQLVAAAGHTDVYKYLFSYKGRYSTSELNSLRNYGPSHSDEIFYLFKSFGGALKYPPGHQDLEVIEMMLTLFTNFAKYGNPTPGNNTGNYLADEIKWLPILDKNHPEYEFMHMRYLNIGQVITNPQNVGYLAQGLGPVRINMAEDIFRDRMDFWDSLPLNEN